MPDFFPPDWLLRLSVAAVWLYEGLWCKLLRRAPWEFEVVKAVPKYGKRFGEPFLVALGAIETMLAVWVLSGIYPIYCALTQTVLLVCLNTNGLLWSRDKIHDPFGMLVKNFAFLVLIWVAASQAGGAWL